MIFFSAKGACRQVLSRSTYKYIKTGADLEEKVPVFGVTCQFEPLPGQGIALRGKLWKGKLDTELAAEKLNRTGSEVTAEQLTVALMNHRNYGRDFIAFGDDGEAVEDEALLTEVGDGSFICQACDQVIKNRQGVQGHFGSDKHKKNRDAYIAAVRKQFSL